MSTNLNYRYLSFASMPSPYLAGPVSPHRPVYLNKKMHRVEFPETLFTLAPNTELEIIFMDGYINGSASEHISFFIQYNTVPTNTIQSRSTGSKRALTGKPTSTDLGSAYIGGFIRVTGGSTGILTNEWRYYEPTSITVPVSYLDIATTGSSAIRTNNGILNRTNINCIPSELKFKRFLNLTAPDFHRMVCHVKIRNTSATVSATTNVYGCWFVETNDAQTGGVSYSQDTKCPMKLAEYVLGYLRNTTLSFSDDTNEASKLQNLDASITTAITEVAKSWEALITSNDPATEVEDWSLQQTLGNN